MRLSTERDRDETTAIAVLHAALDAGVNFLDTADAYCWDDDERGHNERLIARALKAWPGDRPSIVVATKGGMTRPGGRWVANGRAKHLAAACEASCRSAGRGAHPPLSTSRSGPSRRGSDERPRARHGETPGPHRQDWAVQRHGGADRRSETDRRDRLNSGRVEPLAGSALPQRRRSVLCRQPAASAGVSPVGRQ